MKRKMLVLLFSALLVPFAARAQTNPATLPPRASSIEDDPQFKRLSPEQQELVRKTMQNLDKAVADDRKNGANSGLKPGLAVPFAQTGCTATPAKKPRFHRPKAVQDAIRQTGQADWRQERRRSRFQGTRSSVEGRAGQALPFSASGNADASGEIVHQGARS